MPGASHIRPAFAARSRLALLAAGVLVTAMVVTVGVGSAVAAEEDGYSRVRAKKAGISFLAPDDWDRQPAMTRREAKRFLAENDAMRRNGWTVNAVLAADAFTVRWDRDGDGYSDRWVQVVLELGLRKRDLTLERFTRKEASSLPEARDWSGEQANVAGKRAVIATTTVPFARDDGSEIVAKLTIFGFANSDGDVLSLGFWTALPDDAEFDQMIDTMAASLKLLK